MSALPAAEIRDRNNNRVIVRDVSSTPYFCSLGLYWEELKFSYVARLPALIVDLIIWGLTLIASLVAAVGLCAVRPALAPDD